MFSKAFPTCRCSLWNRKRTLTINSWSDGPTSEAALCPAPGRQGWEEEQRPSWTFGARALGPPGEGEGGPHAPRRRSPWGQSALAKSRLPRASSPHPWLTTSSGQPWHHAESWTRYFYPESFQIRELHSPRALASELPVAFPGAGRRGRSSPQTRARPGAPPHCPGATRAARLPDIPLVTETFRPQRSRRDSNRPF